MNESPKLYWGSLGLFCLAMVGGGIADLLRLEQQVEIMETLHYPLYLLTIIGVSKLAGVVVLITPGRPILKEWAYAGFSVDLIGATASHAFVADPIFPTILPSLIWSIGMVSYFSRPSSRRITGARQT
jgi:hypothetical protein